MDGRKTEGLKERREGGSKKIERKRRREGGRGNKERKEGIIYSTSKTSASLCSLHPTQHASLLLLSSCRVSHLPTLFGVTHTRTAVCCSIFPAPTPQLHDRPLEDEEQSSDFSPSPSAHGRTQHVVGISLVLSIKTD